MSVGGRVAYTKDLGYMIEIATWEQDSPHGDFVAIRVEKNLIVKQIQPGDVVWWQGRKAYWTPQTRTAEVNGEWVQAEDVEMSKVANSYRIAP